MRMTEINSGHYLCEPNLWYVEHKEKNNVTQTMYFNDPVDFTTAKEQAERLTKLGYTAHIKEKKNEND